MPLQTDQAGYHDSPGPLHFTSAVDVWFAYIRGYLDGHFAPGSEPSRVIVARQEDILRCPEDVVNGLVQLGLPRNDTDFEVIEVLQTG